MSHSLLKPYLVTEEKEKFINLKHEVQAKD